MAKRIPQQKGNDKMKLEALGKKDKGRSENVRQYDRIAFSNFLNYVWWWQQKFLTLFYMVLNACRRNNWDSNWGGWINLNGGEVFMLHWD